MSESARICVLNYYSACSPEEFCEYFSVFAWEFCIEKWRGFLVNFFWSPSPTKRSTKSPRKIRGKFGANFGAKFGTKIRKIQETLVLQLFWPNELSHHSSKGPVLSLNDLKLCKFVSRSDLVLDAANALDFWPYLVLQACISFCSVSDKSGASLFLPCSHKNAVAHVGRIKNDNGGQIQKKKQGSNICSWQLEFEPDSTPKSTLQNPKYRQNTHTHKT